MWQETPALARAWAQSVAPKIQKQRNHPPPFSLRLTATQRRLLEQDAKGRPLGNHIRSLIFEDDGSLRSRKSRRITDAEALGRALGLLGQSDIAESVRRLSDAADTGALPASPDVCAEISQACDHIEQIRVLLIRALGMRG